MSLKRDIFVVFLIYNAIPSFMNTLLWTLLAIFVVLSILCFIAIRLIFKKIEERREFYTFKTPEGEEIPIGI